MHLFDSPINAGDRPVDLVHGTAHLFDNPAKNNGLSVLPPGNDECQPNGCR